VPFNTNSFCQLRVLSTTTAILKLVSVQFHVNFALQCTEFAVVTELFFKQNMPFVDVLSWTLLTLLLGAFSVRNDVVSCES